MAQAEPPGKGQGPPGAVYHPVGNETADHCRGAVRQTGQDARVKRHEREGAAITGETCDHHCDELAVAIGGGFELDHQDDPPGHLFEKLRKGEDAVAAAGERDPGQSGSGPGRDGAGFASQPIEPDVMKHDGAAVGGKPDVAFDRIIMGHCRRKCGSAVLDPAGVAVMQTAMGNRSGGEETEIAGGAGPVQRP